MRAVILAGGVGSRLAPLSLGSCKPMTPLVGRPVLWHIIQHLKGHGITQMTLTLCHNPQEVMAYFGDGSEFGVTITYFIEDSPLGTAGGVKACLNMEEDEDILVMGGDCVCDLDISQAIQFHKNRGGVATLALYPHKTPLEYGLVHLDSQGRITHFLEKPTWGQVMTNLINTGIYILKKSVLNQIPEGERYDFGSQLFPQLLKAGAPLYGVVLEGYWRDMGDCASYLQCCSDALQGKIKLCFDAPKIATGIWSDSPLPPDVTLVPPCYIGKNVTLQPHCLLGPHLIVEEGCQIDSHAMVQRSVLLKNSKISPHVTAYGAILCQSTFLGEGATLHSGTVVGEGARVERRAILAEGVAIWPGKAAPSGQRINQSIVGENCHEPLEFTDGGVIRGVFGESINSEMMLVLGGILADRGEILLGCHGGDGAKIFAQAFASGVGASGGVVRLHPLTSPAQSSWLAQRRGAGVALFVEQEGERCYLHLAGGDGMPLSGRDQRAIQQRLGGGLPPQATAAAMGRLISLSVREGEYSRDIAQRAPLYTLPLHPVTLAVEGDSALSRALSAMGCTVLSGWRQGVPSFSTCHGGQRLTARDEDGTAVDSGQLLALIALIEMEHGGNEIAVAAGDTAAIELVVAGFRGTVLRLGRDGERARAVYATQPWVRDGGFACARIASRMAVTGESLAKMLSKIPRLTAQRREIPLQGGRGQVMEGLAEESDQPWDGGEGLRFRRGGGWVYLAPLSRRAAIQVVAEGLDMEVAAELCDTFAARAKAIDCRCCQQDSQETPKK